MIDPLAKKFKKNCVKLREFLLMIECLKNMFFAFLHKKKMAKSVQKFIETTKKKKNSQTNPFHFWEKLKRTLLEICFISLNFF